MRMFHMKKGDSIGRIAVCESDIGPYIYIYIRWYLDMSNSQGKEINMEHIVRHLH